MRSIGVSQWIMNKNAYQVRGQWIMEVPYYLDRTRRDLETASAQHFHELCRSDLVILLHLLFYDIQHCAGELKRPTTPW